VVTMFAFKMKITLLKNIRKKRRRMLNASAVCYHIWYRHVVVELRGKQKRTTETDIV
jgi:hypothetical protein